MITGRGRVIAHIGFPTEAFKAPMIYNPWFEANGIDAIVTPMGVRPADFESVFPSIFRMTTVHGALLSLVSLCAPVASVGNATKSPRRTVLSSSAGLPARAKRPPYMPRLI